MMTSTYLQVTPISGKWYMSERVPAVHTRWQVIDPTQERPKRLPSEMILAGPFDSRDQAKNWNILANASGYIWER